MAGLVNQAQQAASGATEGANSAVSRGDEARGDVSGGRKGKSAIMTDGDEDDDPPGDAKEDREKPSSLKIHIKLNLDVEVHLTARVKGDITIGLL